MKLLRHVRKRKGSERRPAVFLDRDGTLIRHRDIISKEGQVRLLSGVDEGLARLQKLGFLLIVVTNQPNIEKEIITVAQAKSLNEHMYRLLKKKGVSLSAAYTCPHRFPSICSCRKPGLGLIRAAQKDFKIDMKKSWFIGDTTRDMETGKRAKVRTIRVTAGDRGSDNRFFKAKGDFVVRDIPTAARIIEKYVSAAQK